MSVAENKNHYTSLSSDKYNIHFGVESFIQEVFEVYYVSGTVLAGIKHEIPALMAILIFLLCMSPM